MIHYDLTMNREMRHTLEGLALSMGGLTLEEVLRRAVSLLLFVQKETNGTGKSLVIMDEDGSHVFVRTDRL